MILDTTPEHVHDIVSGGLRHEREQSFDSIMFAVRNSIICKSGLVGDRVACMFGVQMVTPFAAEGYMWLLTTPLVEVKSKTFLRQSRKFIQELPLAKVVCMVYSNFELSIRWLQWMGFAECGKTVLNNREILLMEKQQWLSSRLS